MAQAVARKSRKTIELAEELGYVYREYAHYTLLDRAIADVRDGFKPVHRRIVYAMGDMGLGPTAQHRKSARVVGEVLGKYHPHGDQSVYDALARMAQDFSLRDELIDGQGNFGSIDGDSPAAMRYTECRLSSLGGEMLHDIRMDTVDWQDNFDNSLQEPVVLPTRFLNVLVNGSSGIAVGFAANLAPHNLGEVCDAVTLMCKGWKKRKQLKVIVQETAEIKDKYATPRRTTIVDAAPGEKGSVVTSADLAVPDGPQMVVVTTKGVERCDASEYSYRVRSGATSRAVTAHRMRVRAEPTDKVLLVSSAGRAWLAPVGQAPNEATESKLGLGREERIVHLSTHDPDDCLVLGTARGVAGIRLGSKATLVGGAVLRTAKRCEIFVLSEKGYLKRVPLGQFTVQGRGGKGMQALKVTKATGPIVAAAAGRVIQATRVDIVAQDGKRQRIPLQSIPRARTRQSRGKKLVTIGPASEIVLW